MSADGQLLARLPIQVYEQDWPTEGFGRYSPNYTGKTLGVPENTARRHWGIMLSPAEDESEEPLGSLMAQTVHLGSQPLDEVKDWAVDWPDPMAGAQWAEETSKAGQRALDTMREYVAVQRSLGNLVQFAMWKHRLLTHGRYGAVSKVIDSPADLTAEDRSELRRLCAFQAYEHNSPDAFPWGVGCHLGNPNMSIMAVDARTKAALLVKDHPMFKAWGTWTLEFMRTYIRRFTRESGAPYENAHYTLGVTLTGLAKANKVLMENGIGDALDTDRFRRCMHFLLDWLTPPDPRFKGHRLSVPFGNGNSYNSVRPPLGKLLVTYFKDRDPELAGKLQWYTNQTRSPDKHIKLVKEVVPELKSVHY